MPDPADPEAPPPAIARDAASLLVLRHRLHGRPEVLMGLRGANHKFMPNRLVFPGGRVDDEDHDGAPASSLRPAVKARLERSASKALAGAIGIAAARELMEETGLSLGNPPHLEPLDYIARAITPDRQPIRFDARFMVVDGEHVSGEIAGSGELEDLLWYDIDQALTLDLAFPTRGVMLRLQIWMAMSPAEREDLVTVPTLRNRGWEME